MKRGILATLFALVFALSATAQKHVFVEAESFGERGGWKTDQQSFDVMGSSYLLAHGMGNPVGDAVTTVKFPKTGTYRLWVRTKDWAPFPKGPGEFAVYLDGKPLSKTFGVSGEAGWRWYDGGDVTVSHKDMELRLKDLTGFDGRVDAILFTRKKGFVPPNEKADLDAFRKKMLGDLAKPKSAGNYDLVVVGGGVSGMCAAISGARKGLKVALVQNRPVLGGNNSSEIRVHLMGSINYQNKYPEVLGKIVNEIDNGDPGNGHVDGKRYGDNRKLKLVEGEENITLFLNMHAFGVEMKNGKIASVLGRDIETNQTYRFSGTYFSDCTGDGTIGYLAGAEYRIGRESKAQTGESMAPEKKDDFLLGMSNLWVSTKKSEKSAFPETPWALQFTDEYYIDAHKADWQWETGFTNLHQIDDVEEIRDHNLRAIYGNWSFLKNKKGDKYAYHALDWVSYVGGKRESRRLIGDHVLNQMDLQDDVQFEDGMVTATWTIDLHFPDKKNSKYFPGQEFMSATEHIRVAPYDIPYRCLYSKNIDNLFMAGRNISTTHIAFGSTRVMRTCGMMGEVVGIAAYLAKKHDTDPRGVYKQHLEEFKRILKGESLAK
ncbi:pyridine nucleotide-disulfide oxidoreductase [Fulvitalea axinellae]|uniref:Pyridine nucleotide-disulfide oxidoreductase n=1 Tax=Fulvitalea axinellae TaxID=1182444 RepID=A0AAU9DCH9_9BACT|nr:pyridine nucleotide-disulfide oxidoreductase [Fulvitalea axinellae]